MDTSRFWQLIELYGQTPIPKYIKSGSLSEGELREKYQSIFANVPASVAAPTASLHFTERVLNALREIKCDNTEITLHVGPGTFAPITPEHFSRRKLHTEYINISPQSAEKINASKKGGGNIVAVGTTATRTLESSSNESGVIFQKHGPIDLFIFPPYSFKMVDILITNFHLPKSSLMLLVDTFLKHKHARRSIADLYGIAIEEKFRFYSFGDAMLIL